MGCVPIFFPKLSKVKGGYELGNKVALAIQLIRLERKADKNLILQSINRKTSKRARAALQKAVNEGMNLLADRKKNSSCHYYSDNSHDAVKNDKKKSEVPIQNEESDKEVT